MFSTSLPPLFRMHRGIASSASTIIQPTRSGSSSSGITHSASIAATQRSREGEEGGKKKKKKKKKKEKVPSPATTHAKADDEECLLWDTMKPSGLEPRDEM
ncbi:hypothetical protein EYF80_057729 [Liparis tanakae]|uniref:Uncharacterized protein n=1 Tax=Liparis tanakae TaxID=230148 RepID=A0A4Z2ETI8_9TELE|nr:hypothetical protein EYF80_057729 [Liparis tanakae]